MRELIKVFLVTMGLVIVSSKRTLTRDGLYDERRYITKDHIFITIAALYMSFFVGLRTWYNDTVTYYQGYAMLHLRGGIFHNLDWSIGENPFFWLVNRILKYFDFSVQSFFLFYAALTLLIYVWFLRKYSVNIPLTFYLFFTMGCFTFTMAAIKQCVAVAFCLVATDRIFQGKKAAFLLYVFVAAMFHPYAFMFLLVPFLDFSPWSNKTWYMFGIFAGIGCVLQSMLGVLVELTSMMGEEYDVSSFSGGGVNVFRLLVIWSPVILSALSYKSLKKSKNRIENVIINLMMLNAEIMFIALFGTANYFARLANYFLIFQTLALPIVVRRFGRDSKIIKFIVIVCYFLYFYYANAIDQPFDLQFSRITVWDYLKTLW